MTIILRVTRSSGATEEYELEADGDVAHVPLRLLLAEDIIGLDIEVEEDGAAEWAAA